MIILKEKIANELLKTLGNADLDIVEFLID